jgi:uncharacterized protein YbjQ (UPF0145 family)
VTGSQLGQEVLRERMLAGQAAAVLRTRPGTNSIPSRVSGLTPNENFLVGSTGWEAIDVCSGAAVYGMRRDTVNIWGADQDARASDALGSAMAAAVERLEAQSLQSGGHGVIGVEIHTDVEPRYVAVNVVGTAIRPIGSSKSPDRAFASNLTSQAFVLLLEAEWSVLGLASGCQFVRAYRRRPTQAMVQKLQNVELTIPTQALAAARSATMTQLEARAKAIGGIGVVQMSLTSGPVPFATHVQSFVAWGTVVVRKSNNGRHPSPTTAVSMNDHERAFDPSALTAAPVDISAE